MKNILLGLLLLPTLAMAIPSEKAKDKAYLEGCKIGFERLSKDYKINKKPNCLEMMQLVKKDDKVKKEWAKENNLTTFKFHGCFFSVWSTILDNKLLEDWKKLFPTIDKICNEFKPKGEK